MMEERYKYRMSTKGWGKLASPWFTYKQVDQTDAKECSICWDECTSYLYCANSEEHIVCKDCSKEIIVNNAFVNSDASIDINWKCPICRHDNEIGSWQFLPSTEQIKAKEGSTERILQQAQEGSTERIRQQAQGQPPRRSRESTGLTQAVHQISRLPRRQRLIEENRLSRIDENAPPKFRWVLSLDWKKSIVNHFKAWIMYNSPGYGRPPSGAELTALKEQHYYEERKRSPQAPWFNFLERTTPP